MNDIALKSNKYMEIQICIISNSQGGSFLASYPLLPIFEFLSTSPIHPNVATVWHYCRGPSEKVPCQTVHNTSWKPKNLKLVLVSNQHKKPKIYVNACIKFVLSIFFTFQNIQRVQSL